MHYNIYLAEKIPAIEENKKESLEVLAEIERLKPDAAKKEFKENWNARYGIKFLTSRLTSFAREVSDSVCRRLEPFRQDTDDPQYLQFDDMTEELKDEYKNGTTTKVKLPNGTYLEPYLNLDGGYTVYNGKVYKSEFGQLKHRKRNKRAKKMQVVEVPNRKLYKTYEEFADERYTFNPETGTYGYFWNPQAFYDWFSIGGRWPCEFLVKEDCFESSLGEIDYDREPTKAPEGYKWVCFARKKDIQWQVMRDTQFKDLSEDYEYLRACFEAGEMLKEEDKAHNYYSIKENKILYWGDIVYVAGETFQEYLDRHNFNDKYGLLPYGFLSIDDEYIEREYVCISISETDKKPDIAVKKREEWHRLFEDFIESTNDEDVIVSVDIHM